MAQHQARPLTATVLIPCHNEAATLPLVLAVLTGQSYPLDAIVVVADSCTDRTADIARDFGCVVYETAFGDKASNQNAALPFIESDVVVGFDGDTVPTSSCVRMMVESMQVEQLDATCATILPIQRDGLFIQSRRFAYALGRRWWRLCQVKVGRMQVMTGAAYAFRTDAIKAVGGFPNGLISADMDATWALHKAGCRLGYAAEALAYTLDPETFTEYRAQMRRWASGYFQTMSKYRRELLNWRSMLVVWTAVFDLLTLFWVQAVALWASVTGHPGVLRGVMFWVVVHWVATGILVASVVGWREAARGILPYTIVNVYNKWLYLCAFTREWILGRHYASWTGRHGTKLVITPMTRRRRWALGSVAAFFTSMAAGFALGGWMPTLT